MSYRMTYHEDADGRGIIRYSGDAQGLVDHCADYAKAHRENGRFAAAKKDMRKILSIDPVVAMEVARQRGMDYFNPELWREFTGRDYAKFRCVDDSRLWKGGGRKLLKK